MVKTNLSSKFRFAIDRGGTFTDVYAETPNGPIVTKLLSVDPANYEDAPREGIRRILEEVTGLAHPKDQPIDTSRIESIRMGTTVATNALLERKGERIALITTKGFGDLLRIGNQARPKIFDLQIRKLGVLFEQVVEIDERCVLKRDDDNYENGVDKNGNQKVLKGLTGEELIVEKPIDHESTTKKLQAVYDSGIRSLSVVFMHSYLCDVHELIVAEIAKKIGFSHVSLSSKVMPMVKIVPRGYTTCADGYLTPAIKTYIHSFQKGFDENINKVNVMFMQSDGGLASVNDFNGSRAILSGPAGGVVGYGRTAYGDLTSSPVIGFDMGGTSTDVSRFSGTFEHVFETSTAGITIQAPQLDINTVAAGGGSRLFFRSGMFVVGPESVGAHPGPVCYRKGGHLAITDANLLLGRLCVDKFPKIFGPNEDQPLDVDATRKAFEDLTAEINEHNKNHTGNTHQVLTCEEVAYGFIQVANESMCRPIRSLTQSKGYDTCSHALSCFGGAGGQHAVAIARALGMKEIFVHRYAGILSAYGINLADVIVEVQRPCAHHFDKLNENVINDIDMHFKELIDSATQSLEGQNFTNDTITMEKYLNMRYDKTDCALMIKADENEDFETKFLEQYNREFGFTIPGRAIIIDDIRVRGVGMTPKVTKNRKIDEGVSDGIDGGKKRAKLEPEPISTALCYFENGYESTPIYDFDDLCLNSNFSLNGPCIITQQTSTILIEPDCTATLIGDSLKIIFEKNENKLEIGTALDPIQLGIFSHRFMSIAEQMGLTLQRTSISTNIKDRLDFSCALFGPDGGLVANAPHVPVHLGAMQESVKYQIKVLGDDLKPGDVIVSNHPKAGGSHLPDITCITPVFSNGSEKPVFFVASRGHHADIGGITPGSMPPTSQTLSDEGFACKSFHLVRNGIFQEQAISDMLNEAGTRGLGDNISDLKAQVAANNCGTQLVNDLISQYGLNVVHAYMDHIQLNASECVKDSLKEIYKKYKTKKTKEGDDISLFAEDYMDDGSRICVNLTINENGFAVFDFSGTGEQVIGNLNAPKAVTFSAAIYCLRCLVPYDIPLNQGCLLPAKFVIPEGSMLDPSEEAAVVGGNVLTSQRVVDVLLKVLGVCAASQGCMNNLTFGDENVGYYETIAGGAGAGPGWHGTSGVHTHMTNTRITDPEIIERRYPVILREFSLRSGSGGEGKYRGGDGVVRKIEFRKPMVVSLLSERRAFQPYGLKGGNPGTRGINRLYRSSKEGKAINIGGKTTVKTDAGDVLLISTPGGGGYGSVDDPEMETEIEVNNNMIIESGSVAEYRSRQEQC